MSTADGSGAPGEERKESKTRKRLWGMYRLYSWYSRFNTLSKIWAFLTSKAAVATAVVAVGGAGAVAALKPELLRGLLGPSRVAVATERWGDSSIVFPVDGIDEAGRKASFDVVVMTRDFTWVRGSSDQLARQGIALSEAQVGTEVLTAEIRNGLSKSADLIAVGTASQEGVAANETGRADRRSRTSARWLSGAVMPPPRIWLLNLGQFQEACGAEDTTDTAWQRPFMMIGVRKQEAGVDLGQALKNAISDKSNLPSPDCYSQFQLVRNG